MSEVAPWEDDATVEPSAEAAPWESDSISDVPQADDSGIDGVMRPVRGFEKLENVVHLMKTESIPAHLIKWMTTPEETYRKKERIEKDEYIKSIPMLSAMNERMDEIEWMAGKEGMSGELEDEHNILLDAYGTAYGKMEEAYDKGELETGFSWEGFKGAIKDDPTGMLSEVINVFMADPELLMTPIGWEYAAAKTGMLAKGLGASEKVTSIAKVTGGITGSASLGSGLAAADNASRQLSEKGEVDEGQVLQAAQIGAIAAPILIGGFKMARVGSKGAYGKISESRFNNQFKKSISRVETKAQEYLANGLRDENAALHRAINNSHIPNNVRKAMSERHDWMRNVNMTEEAVDAKRASLAADADKIKTKFWKTIADPTKKFTADLLGNLSTELGFVHEGLRHAVKRLDMDTAISMKHGLDVKDTFKGVYKGLSKEDKVDLNIALGNGQRKSVVEILSRSNASGEAKNTVTREIDDYFNDVYNRSEVANMGLKKIDNYFPMEVKDYNAFAKHMGFEPSYIGQQLSKAVKKAYKDKDGAITKVRSTITIKEAEEFLSNDEIINVLNKALATPFKSVGKSTTHMKGRTMEVYTKDNIQFYRDPVESFANYVTSMEPKIQETMFFGGKSGSELPHSAFLSRSIGGLSKKLLDAGEIIPDDLSRLEELLTARFIQGTRAPKKLVTGLKNVLYSATLGNPLSAMTQLGDVGSAAYINGVMETMRTTPIVMAGKGIFKMEDFGLNNIVQEFEHLGKTAKMLDFSLKWSGFKSVDRLGKEVLLNSTLHKYGNMAKSVKGRKKLVDKYKDAFTPAEMNKVLDDLKKGNHTQDVKYLMWHELTRVQPVALSEMPVSYLRNPNARMFYMLKTFTLKQLDLMRREAYQTMKSGDVAGGMANLTKWTGILGLSNATVEQSKAWVRGEDVEFGDLFYAQMFRNYGLSQYVLDQIARGQPILAATTLAMPPIGIGDDVVQDLVNFGDTFKSLKHVPVFGKGMFYLFDMDEK